MNKNLFLFLSVIVLGMGTSLVSAVTFGSTNSSLSAFIIEYPSSTSNINYSTINVNNSQYLQGLTPAQVAALFTSPYLYNMTLFSIGQTVIGGTANNVLFIDGTGNVGQSNFFKYANAQLNLTQVDGIVPLLVNGNATITGNITAARFYGDGSGLTNLNETDTLQSVTNRGAITNNSITVGNTTDAVMLTNIQGYGVVRTVNNARNLLLNGGGSTSSGNGAGMELPGVSSNRPINLHSGMNTGSNAGFSLDMWNGATWNTIMRIWNASSANFPAGTPTGVLLINATTRMDKPIIVQKGSGLNRYLSFGGVNNYGTLVLSDIANDGVYSAGLNGQPMIFINQTRETSGGSNQVPFMRILANQTASQNAILDWYVGGVDSTTKSALKLYSTDSDPEFCISNQKQGNIVACNGGAGAGGARFGVNSAGSGGRGAQFFVTSSENANGQWIGSFMFNNVNSTGDGIFKSVGALTAKAEDENYNLARLSIELRRYFQTVNDYPIEAFTIYPDHKINTAQLSNSRTASGGMGIGLFVANPDALSTAGDISVLGATAQRTVFSDATNTGITNGVWVNDAGREWLENPTAGQGYNCTSSVSTNGCTMRTVINTTAGMEYYITYNVYSLTNGSLETYYWLPSGKYFAETRMGSTAGGNTFGFAFTAENATTTLMLNTSAGAKVSRLDAFSVKEYGTAKVKAGTVWSKNIYLRGNGTAGYGGNLSWWDINGRPYTSLVANGDGWLNLTGTNNSLSTIKTINAGNFSVNSVVGLTGTYNCTSYPNVTITGGLITAWAC